MNTTKKLTLHFIQDIPTPHNNVLLKALRDDSAIDLYIWYARLTHPQYSFKAELGYEVGMPTIYGYKLPSWHLIRTVFFNKSDKFFIVGWMNPTTRFLVLLFWILRRPYNIWFDCPQHRPFNLLKSSVRNFYYFILKKSKAKIFAVGENTVQYFKKRGFSEEGLVNLPIFVEVNKSIEDYRKNRTEIRSHYQTADSDFFIVTGSRLIYEKGFDLLIDAIANLDEKIKKNVKLLIVGKGPEKQKLIQKVSHNKLGGSIFFEDWMTQQDFMKHIGAADLVVHPARFDAYGGITLSAMIAGVPVVGSNQAGSAKDRISHGLNGWLYDCNDVSKLTYWISIAIENPGMLEEMGRSARETADHYTPSIGATQLLEQLI